MNVDEEEDTGGTPQLDAMNAEQEDIGATEEPSQYGPNFTAIPNFDKVDPDDFLGTAAKVGYLSCFLFFNC